MRAEDALPLQNLYLIVGIRGGFTPRTRKPSAAFEVAVGHTLDRWGISPLPWGPCDSGGDLESPGAHVVRAWNHVDLRVSGDDRQLQDVPVSGLLRATWDALDLFGSTDLTGVVVSAPLACAGRQMWARVAGSVVRALDRADEPASVLAEARTLDEKTLDVDAVLSLLSEFAELGDPPHLAPPPPTSPSAPLGPFPTEATFPLRAGATLAAWTIDDAAWLAEAVTVCCREAGVTGDVEVAVTVGAGRSPE